MKYHTITVPVVMFERLVEDAQRWRDYQSRTNGMIAAQMPPDAAQVGVPTRRKHVPTINSGGRQDDCQDDRH